MISGNSKTSKTVTEPDNSSYTSRATSQRQERPSVQGVKILGFRAKSGAREAGMQKDDVIIEYGGTRNLTTETLLALTTMTRPDGTGVGVAFLRNGREYSLPMPPGPLGISAMDTMTQGSSGLRTGVKSLTDQKPHPIPVLEVIHEAMTIPWHKRATMFSPLLRISVVLIALHFIMPLVREELGRISYLVWRVLFGLAFAVFAVTCHRIILLGKESVPKSGLASWSLRETRFVGWTLLIALCGGVTAGIVGIPVLILLGFFIVSQKPGEPWVTAAGSIMIMIPASYLFARLSVLLPATAVDEQPDFAWAWELTKGNGWRLFLVVGVLPGILWLGPDYLLGRSVIIDLLIYATACVLYVIEIAALSLSYRHLIGRHAWSGHD